MQYFSTNEKPILGEIRAGLFKTAPTGWLMLDGSTFDEDEYPRLYELLGTNTLPDMRAATICGKGDAEPDEWDVGVAKRNKTNYDSGAIGDIVGENGQLVPRHRHDVKFVDASESIEPIYVKTSGGTSFSYAVSVSSGTGNPAIAVEPQGILGNLECGETIYTDVRGKRLLCNFIIRAR